MKIDVNHIKNQAQTAAKTTLSEATKVGKYVRETVGSKLPKNEKVDQFTKTIGEKLKANNININKDTAIGVGLCALAFGLAVKCAKGIVNKISEIKKS